MHRTDLKCLIVHQSELQWKRISIQVMLGTKLEKDTASDSRIHVASSVAQEHNTRLV